MLRIRRPQWGYDYGPGDVAFTMKDGNFLSEGIAVFQNLYDLTSRDFVPSHCFLVVDEFFGVESSEYGAEFFLLKPRFADPKLTVFLRKPSLLDCVAFEQMLEEAHRLVVADKPYDYLGLLVGYPLAKLLNLTSFIRVLRKMPLPFRIPWGFVCSGFISHLMKTSDKYKNHPLFEEWHESRITPVMLMEQGPFQPIGGNDGFPGTPSRDAALPPATGDILGSPAVRNPGPA